MAASLLDRGREGGYQHRLTMYRSGAHNRGVLLPTRAAVPLPTRFHRPARVLLNEAGFPAELGSMPQPVSELWYVGRLPRPGERGLAIVGARAASIAMCRLARELAASAVRHGHAVVSGGALGIDAAAHRGALDAGGVTFAVLGCGVDVVYPDRHAALFADVAATGGLLSEYAPGTQPRFGQFPARNRIIAALAETVLVVEAGFASGALITARVATKLGRKLLAVPGSPGTDALIATGAARPVHDVEELRCALAGEVPPERPVPARFASLLAELRGRVVTPAELARHLKLPLGEILALAAEAELDGWICRRPGGALASMESARGN
jgi:DNA processing protein